jgi:ribosomal protein S18 acetylase RimI-like enzyme
LVEVTLRPAGPADRDFLAAVYASTREEELAPVPWTAEEKAVFLRSQFDAQDTYYKLHYPAAEYLVIQAGAELAGRLYVARLPGDIRIVDIALLPPFRAHGIGAEILRPILEEGDRLRNRVSIHVERNNRALRFYERLGFRLAEDKGVYLFLVRPPVS